MNIDGIRPITSVTYFHDCIRIENKETGKYLDLTFEQMISVVDDVFCFLTGRDFELSRNLQQTTPKNIEKPKEVQR